MPTQSLYDEVVRVTYVYLGPAADRFVSRQITNHLGKQPDMLQVADLPELISWIKLAMGFLTEDVAMVEDYTIRLQSLQHQPADRHTKQRKTIAHKATDYAGEAH